MEFEWGHKEKVNHTETVTCDTVFSLCFAAPR